MVKHTDQLQTLFSLPLSEIAFQQFGELQGILADIPITEDNDQWTYIWGSAVYRTDRAYKQLIGHMPLHRPSTGYGLHLVS